MGDRANFGIRQNDGQTIYVYGHWAGENMLARFANAIQAASDAGRLPGDEAYANRIIVSQIIGEDWANQLGWGLTVNYIADNEHKIPVYDHSTDTISLYEYSWQDGGIQDKVFEMSRESFVRKYAKSVTFA